MDILAIASFAGAHYLRVFAKKKLGFVRWLNFNGAKLSESIPFDTRKSFRRSQINVLDAFEACANGKKPKNIVNGL